MVIHSEDITTIVDQLVSKANGQKLLLFIAENSKIDVQKLIDLLNENNIQFFGGVFPKIISEGKVQEQGIVVNFLPQVISSFITTDLDSKEFSIPVIELPGEEPLCAITLVDGLTGNISHFLSELYRVFGSRCSYFGGGAGSLTLEQKPCLFDNTGFYMNAALTIICETQINIGVKHGWKKITGPMIATKTDKNVIQEINWRNAFEVYKAVIEKDAGKEIRKDNFFDIAKAYPFGMIKENSECVVRDPIATNDDGELICVGEVSNNTALDILKGYEENLISSAKEAVEIALKNSKNPQSAIVVDCISRVLFLEDKFQDELANVIKSLVGKNNKIKISGILTLGEISSYNGFLEFYNKTIVVGLFD